MASIPNSFPLIPAVQPLRRKGLTDSPVAERPAATTGDGVSLSGAQQPTRSASWARRVAGSLVLSLAALGHPVWAAGLQEMPALDKAREMQILGGSNRPAQLVRLADGEMGKGATITVHGANGKPEDLQAWSELAQSQGQEVHTLAFDDMKRRLRDNSQDLARHLDQWFQSHPGQPLNLQAYCMGARIALGALVDLQKQGKLPDQPIQLTLLAPPLAGIASADWAQLDIGGLFGTLIPGVRIGYDMGPSSDFQKQLEQLKLPETVKTRILIGAQDAVVDASEPRWQRLAKNLNAEVTVLPGVDHNTIAQKAVAF